MRKINPRRDGAAGVRTVGLLELLELLELVDELEDRLEFGMTHSHCAIGFAQNEVVY